MTPLSPALEKSRIPPIWCLMPVLADPFATTAAISDLLAQTVPTRVLVVNQGVDEDFRQRLERLAEEYPDRVFVWHHQPPLLSLSATWNRALDFVWEQAEQTEGNPDEWVALVVNNDVRLHRATVQVLSTVLRRTESLFVSAVGVHEENWFPDVVDQLAAHWLSPDDGTPIGKGGPDFSCFLISWQCHRRWRFDEAFIPCFAEDLDCHRRMMLGGDGERIFSINMPYLHLASNTLKTLPPEQANRIRHQIETISRAYYAKKWGGAVNQETFWTPFGQQTDRDPDIAMLKLIDQPTTPKLQAYVQQRALTPTLTDFDARDKLMGDDFSDKVMAAGYRAQADALDPARGWTDADHLRALGQPEDLDE